MLKKVRKCELLSNICWCLNRDAMSANLLNSPSMLKHTSGEACLMCCRRASARMRNAPGTDVALSLLVQATDDVLSQKMLVCLNFKSVVICSSTSHWRSTPAISKSLMLRSPLGLSFVFNRCWTSLGNVMRQTTYGSLSLPPIQMPPAPYLHASHHPK